MMNEIKTNEHYVPRFYLQGFTGDDGKLASYHYADKKFTSILPKNICFEKHLYETPWETDTKSFGKFVLENNIENVFCQYEGEFAKLLKEITCICYPRQNPNALILHSDEKTILCRFIANLLIRNPFHMKNLCLDIIPEKIKEKDEIIQLCDLWKRMGFDDVDSLCVAGQKRAVLLEEIPGSTVNELIEKIEKLNFFFFYTEESEFITSDNPVCIGHDPLNEGSILFYLALTPRISVVFENYANYRLTRNRMFLLDADLTDSLNKFHMGNTDRTRFLLGRSTDTLRKYIKSEEGRQC